MSSVAGVSFAELARLTLEHLGLVVLATGIAAAVGVPLGVVASERPKAARAIVAITGALQVVPSLALFGLLLPVPVLGGIGTPPAVVALVLYALFPIVRATIAGVGSVEPSVREAALAMGMTQRQIRMQVELPLATAVIASGLRTALVIGVGVATVAAAIGAGGLGTLIFRGLRMNDEALVLAGAVPAAALAFILDAAVERVAALLQARVTEAPEASRAPVAWLLAAAMLLATTIAVAFLGDGRTSAMASSDPRSGRRPRLTVCTKDFTEQVILGEILAQGLEARGVDVVRRFELGGHLCHEALVAGTVDVYPEYTGTAYTALLGHPPRSDAAAVLRTVREDYAARFDVAVSDPLGFANDFVILMRAADRNARELRTLTDLARAAPSLRAGFGQDFLSRADGYPGLVAAYGLHFAGPPAELDLSLTYRALSDGRLEETAGYSTHGLIDALDLAVVEDDRHYFPPYQAVWLARRARLRDVPALGAELAALAAALPTATMRRLNREADAGKQAPADVARRFRASR